MIKATPRNYQRKNVNTIIKRFGTCALLADEMGLGKSLQSIMIIDRHKDDRVLIACPSSLKFNWVAELKKFLPNETPYVCQGQKPTKGTVNNRIIICNYEILKFWRRFMLHNNINLIIYDESQFLKNEKALRTKAATQISQGCDHRVLLTGTPIENKPVELFSQLKIINPSLFPSWLLFAKRYNGAKKDTFGWQLHRATNVKELNKILTTKCMVRKKKKDVLTELPDKIRQVIPLEISNRKEYDDAKDNIIKWLRKNTQLNIKKAKKARQVIELDKLKFIAAKGKMKAITNYVNEMSPDQKLVVFCYHKKIIEELSKKIKNHVLVDSSKTSEERQDMVDKFQDDPKTRVFLTTIRVGGTGLTLTASSTTIFVQQDWNAAKHDQAEDRVHRIGQTADVVNAIYFVAMDTVEEKIVRLIDARRQAFSSIIDGELVDDKDLISELISEVISDG